jgi:hypothetical protein
LTQAVLLIAALWAAFAPIVAPPPAAEPAGNLDLEKARRYFAEFDDLCARDGGRLWGVSFCGPILLVDPSTRMAAGNRKDATGVLQPRDGVFTGRLPADVGIANTAVDWSGARWTMLIWPALTDDRAERLRLLAHESFHRLQPQLGLTPVGELNTHLDTADGRWLIQLEWQALSRSLTAEGQARRDAVADALTFRNARRARFPEAAAREAPLEIFEGLAEYSGARLAGFSGEQVAREGGRSRIEGPGFVRSFAYVSGPLYGFLLDGTPTEWRRRVRPETDLGALLGELLQVSGRPADAVDRAAESYGGAALRAAESERARKREAQVASWRAALVDGPVLILDLRAVASASFDPYQVFPLGDTQTVYTTRTLIAEWGTLHVEKGAVLEDRAALRAHVSLAGASGDFSRGNGWTLQLREGWKALPAERAGDFVVRK